MPIQNLNKDLNSIENKKLFQSLEKLQKLIDGLNQVDLPHELTEDINAVVEDINSFAIDEKGLKRQSYRAYRDITKWVQKETGMVPPGYYRNLWMALGMSVFGVPFGVAFSSALGNFAFIGIGLPIGMSIGIAIGTKKRRGC